MRALRNVWMPVWAATRLYWALGIVALLFALGALSPALVLAAHVVLALLLIAAVSDAVRLPKAADVRVVRRPPEPFAMRRRSVFAYLVQNAANVAVNVTIVEAPCELLQYERDECTARVPARSEVDVTRPVLPVARGIATVPELYVRYTGIFGLFERRVRLREPSEVRVYPDLSAVERYGALHARNRIIEAGLRRMHLRGAGTEFESVREWAPGDDFRSIDWKSTARAGKVMVAEHEVERTQSLMILLDAGRLMIARAGDQRKFDYAVTAAMSVASVAALANDRVGLVAFAGDILRARAPRQSGRSLARLMELIGDIEPRFEEADYDRAFDFVRRNVKRRSLIVFFTDLIDPVAQGAVLGQLRTLAQRHLVICAFMNDAAVDETLEEQPRSVNDAFRQSVAMELRSERKAAAAVLSRTGVRVIDVPAASLTTALIDRYLAVKQRGEL